MLKLLTRLYRFYIFYASPAKRVVRRTVNRFFRDCPPCRIVLEVGGGNATMGSVLQAACRAQFYISSDTDPTDQTAAVCDAQLLPFANTTIDVVAAFEVIEHIPDTGKFLSEAARVLTPEGYLVLSLPFLYGRHDVHDFYRWTPEGLERVLKLHGMKALVIQNRGGGPF